MRRLLLHLSTSFVAFALGVATAMIFGVFSFTRPAGTFVGPAHFEPPPATRSCPSAPKFSQELPPLPPAPPAAPLPPEPPLKGTRVVIRRADGTVQVIETEKRVEQKRKGS